jgi:hypothetical protein
MSTSRGKGGRSSSSEWRDQKSQDSYRESSRSQNKSDQHVSHQVSIEVAKSIDDHNRGPTAAANKAAINSPSNFHMKNAHTNQSIDRKLDDEIITTMNAGGGSLSAAAASRAGIQAAEFQSNPGFTDALVRQADKMYTSLEGNDG